MNKNSREYRTADTRSTTVYDFFFSVSHLSFHMPIYYISTYNIIL